MKAIVLHQPWASAVPLDLKRNETRDWPAVCRGSLYRGWLAICAGKREAEDQYVSLLEILEKSPESLNKLTIAGLVRLEQGQIIFSLKEWPLGAIVAVVWLDNCIGTTHPDLKLSELERLWGNYGPNRVAWQFTECWRLHTPVPVRGERKLFDVQMPADWQDRASKVF